MTFNFKFSSYFEHECSLDKVLGTVEITPKHAILQCEMCKKKYFYRLIPDMDIYERLKKQGYV